MVSHTKKPAAIVHVGDSIQNDLLGALRCGMRALLLTRDGLKRAPADEQARPPADDERWREVRTLEEAEQVLREWGGIS